LVEPLYTQEDVQQTIDQMVGVQYGETLELGDGVTVEFRDAGHILGSAVTLLTMKRGEKQVRLGFTGDLGRKQMPILKDPVPMGDVDYLISESTYGGRVHDPIEGMEKSLEATIRKTADRRGKIIVPAFSVGKTQEFIYALSRLYDAKKVPLIPVFVDSPLAVNATGIFRRHPECFDDETIKILMENEDPFGFGRLTYIRDVEESKRLNDRTEPCVIISASGMCEAGRILHHLANNIEDARNTVLIIGYMAEHTLGRRLVEKHEEVKIFGDIYKRRAEVVVLNSFSAHAGQDELLSYISAIDKRRLKKIFLVHGELREAEQLATQLQELGHRDVTIPARGQKVELF